MNSNEKIGFDGLEEVDGKVKIGDVLFIRVCDIYSWGINHDDVYPQIDNFSEEYIHEVRRKIGYLPDMLVAVKYLGKGLYQEMTTGIIMMAGEYDNQYEDDDEFDNNLLFPLLYKDFVAYYKDFRGGKEPNSTDLSNYIKLCEKYKKIKENHSILVVGDFSLDMDGDAHLIKITEASKKVYLKYGDRLREDALKMIIKIANETYNRGLEALEAELAKYAPDKYPIPKHVENMAYLENELFDFENDGKVRK